MKDKLSDLEIRKIEDSLASIEKGIKTLKNKKEELLKVLGRTEELPPADISFVHTCDCIPNIGDEYEGGIVEGTYVKVRVIGKEGKITKKFEYRKVK